MTDTGYFFNGTNNLYYSVKRPGNAAKTGVIFVHAADANRLGPHRLFVETESRFNLCNFSTMRFDLTGCGDSEGEFLAGNIAGDIKDLSAAIEFFVEKYCLESVILFGISRGAMVCFESISKNLPIKAIICLSMPLSSIKSAAKSFKMRLKEYMFKFKDKQKIKKLITGRINIKQITKTLTKSLGLANRYKTNKYNSMTTKSPILFIYGQNDPIAEDSKKHYTTTCKDNNINHQTVIIKNANHSFFHYKWKEQIINVTEKWILKIADGR